MNVHINEIVIPAFKITLEQVKSVSTKVFGATLSATIGALLIFKTLFNWQWYDSVCSVLVILLGIFLILLGWNLWKYAYKYFFKIYRESVYGEAIILLKDSFAKVHSLKRIKEQGGEISDKEIKNVLFLFCNNLKKIYEKKTRSNCSICIKVVVGNNSKFTSDSHVMTFCRDKESQLKRAENKDYKKRAKNVTHSIFKNSCYSDIFTAFMNRKFDNLYYQNNNLPETTGYRNSSDVIYEQDLTSSISIKERRKNWKMPYKSEIVVPIMPRVNDVTNEYEIIGFLCVDCEMEKVFDDIYGIAIIQGVADGIYDIIKMSPSL